MKRELAAQLDTKQQAIIMGHAVPMPVVVKTRTYDEEFYTAVTEQITGKPVADLRARLGNNGRERRLR